MYQVVTDFVAGTRQADDLTAIIIKRTGTR